MSHRYFYLLLENSFKSFVRVGAESYVAWNDISQAARRSLCICWVVPSIWNDRNWVLFEEWDKWPPPLENKQQNNLEFKWDVINFE